MSTGSDRQNIDDLPTADGFGLGIVQHATFSLAGDVGPPAGPQHPERSLRAVGHAHGGVVVPEAGTHDAAAAVVYIPTFAPDQDDAVNTLIATRRPARLQ
ncbi:hypothetical protein [Nonomuraea angiospora]|uniref:hypothetical protein n=1 Tax=Nonomuraea angiospora TaxID=46172 RepID=UPI00299FDE02|nr:hypothetical protein [Nonomuraea angiospora]MDX3107615.1 hypothetical protein [Nonomuraea angiospora]